MLEKWGAQTTGRGSDLEATNNISLAFAVAPVRR
jgi:hypothetical protein